MVCALWRWYQRIWRSLAISHILLGIFVPHQRNIFHRFVSPFMQFSNKYKYLTSSKIIYGKIMQNFLPKCWRVVVFEILVRKNVSFSHYLILKGQQLAKMTCDQNFYYFKQSEEIYLSLISISLKIL